MSRRKLLWQLYLPFLLVTILSLFSALLFATHSFQSFHIEQIEGSLEAGARLVEARVRSPLLARDQDLESLSRDLGRRSNMRVTLVLPSGEVAADSIEEPSAMDNHLDRPEILAALSGQRSRQIRHSHTLGKKMIYVAIPILERGEIVGAVRTAVPLTSTLRALQGVKGRIFVAAALICLAAMGITLWVYRRISRPLEEMKQGAQRFARGDFQSRLVAPDSQEFSDLAQTMNEMAAQLDQKIRDLTRQREEQQAILASMAEGVIAINAQEQVISINRAACRMFGVQASNVVGKSIQGSIRRASLHQLVARTLSGPTEEEENEVTLETPEQRILQTHAAVLKGAAGERIGALLVLNDITQLKRLEDLRREFVANVSHELRTPLTSIKGFVETLLDGAMRSPDDAERFLKIIAKQADQLTAIIEDLLLLSRVEQDGEKAGITLEEAKLRSVLEAAIEACTAKAAQKDMDIGLKCSEGLTAKINVPLFTQAVINLVDNAINFSEPRTSVQLAADRDEDRVSVHVRDQGCGIREEHLPRLTERFYRVDKARSRKLGGTGLGLAIVKHIVQAHQGALLIESAPGKGSTFSIHIPVG